MVILGSTLQQSFFSFLSKSIFGKKGRARADIVTKVEILENLPFKQINSFTV